MTDHAERMIARALAGDVDAVVDRARGYRPKGGDAVRFTLSMGGDVRPRLEAACGRCAIGLSTLARAMVVIGSEAELADIPPSARGGLRPGVAWSRLRVPLPWHPLNEANRRGRIPCHFWEGNVVSLLLGMTYRVEARPGDNDADAIMREAARVRFTREMSAAWVRSIRFTRAGIADDVDLDVDVARVDVAWLAGQVMGHVPDVGRRVKALGRAVAMRVLEMQIAARPARERHGHHEGDTP